ncbi:MAG: beta-D-glucuronidase [Ignavibacteria bacterium ADurb.Bin266]|nr:MAG: beta-D-glucuronidase [Ignavibacteria bacterium ADurb.Bin266]
MRSRNPLEIILLIIIILLLSCEVRVNSLRDNSVKEKMVLDLSGKWKFRLGDDISWKEKNIDDSNWEKIYVPSPWENQGFQGYNGYAWYRASFKLSKDLSDNQLYLILGYVDDVDQTFINGKLIGLAGGFPPNYRTAYDAFRKYYIPKEYLNKDGENIIAVRVYDNELDGGIISGKIGLYISGDVIEPDINLSGIWDFRTGDDSLFLKEKIDDIKTTKLMVPAHWDIQGYQDYDGFAWYKKSFVVPKKYEGENMILLLGKIDDIDQTFVNGVLVGSTGNWNFKDIPKEFNKYDEYKIVRAYSVPAKILKPGAENTVVVRVYDGYRDGGIYEGPVGLITVDNYLKKNRGIQSN